MKKNLYLVLVFLLFLAVGCKTDDQGGNPGQVGSLVRIEAGVVRPGYKRVRVIWTNKLDANIKRTRVSWSIKGIPKSLIKASNGQVKDSLDIIIDGGKYLFKITNLGTDGSNLSSLGFGVSGIAYGDETREMLVARKVDSVNVESKKFYFEVVASNNVGLLSSTLTYIDHSIMPAIAKSIPIDNTTNELTISGFMYGDAIVMKSLYLPSVKNGLDSIPSKDVDYYPGPIKVSAEVIPAPAPIQPAPMPSPKWTIDSFSSEELAAGKYPAKNAIDGDIKSGWYTTWGVQAPPYWIIIDFGSRINIDQVDTYRLDKYTRKGEYYVSNDKHYWSKIGSFEYPTDAPNSNIETYAQAVALKSAVTCRYLKLVMPVTVYWDGAYIAEIVPHRVKL